MRVPLSWLTEHCDPGMEPEALAERLAMTGTEVERVSHLGPATGDGFVVGSVVSVEAHPDADRLSVCRVDTGSGEARTIVCGAPNVAAGQTVAVALPGAVLPDGTELRQAKLRGVVSDGMILSEVELGLGADGAGIMVLDGGFAPGSPLGEALPVAEPVLELEVTPNRVDCLGVYGVAREVHAVTGAKLAPAPWEDDVEPTGDGSVDDLASVTVDVPELCPRFTARAFTGVTVGPSPAWLRARLIAAGQRPINNVVDVTNYVMLLTAQPLHAFDLDLVPDGALNVCTAAEGEKITTLDGVERVLDSETVLVCDRNGPTGIAGIMGGQVSEVSEKTTRVLLEVANWDGVNILRTSKLLGLRSEASTRFEKQLHPELTMRAQALASRLIVELCGASLVPGTIDVAAEVPAHHRLELSAARVEALLGMAIGAEECSIHLERLGFGVQRDGELLRVEVPADRHYDVTREADLIEEIARVHGLDEHLPATLPAISGQVGLLTREQSLRRRAEDVMRDLGFDEIVGWSFTDPGENGRLRLGVEPIALSNPLSEEQSVMRTTLLGSLLDAASYNRARNAPEVALFESGRVYLREPLTDDPPPEWPGARPAPAVEPACLGAVALGTGFLELKGALEALAGHLGVTVAFRPADAPFLHPGRAAAVSLGGREAAWIGEIHPAVLADWDLEQAAAFELGMASLIAAASSGHEQYEDLISYPAVVQDIAVVVPEEVAAEQVRQRVTGSGGDLLRAAEVFDLYRGEQVGEGRKSLALRLEFRAPDRTLTDEEVAERRDAIRAGLEEIGGSLRE
jgi:phenylalanyl-tRNA synthetase beta chain